MKKTNHLQPVLGTFFWLWSSVRSRFCVSGQHIHLCTHTSKKGLWAVTLVLYNTCWYFWTFIFLFLFKYWLGSPTPNPSSCDHDDHDEISVPQNTAILAGLVFWTTISPCCNLPMFIGPRNQQDRWPSQDALGERRLAQTLFGFCSLLSKYFLISLFLRGYKYFVQLEVMIGLQTWQTTACKAEAAFPLSAQNCEVQ